MPDFEKYGIMWEEGTDPALIEMSCIQKGGQWKEDGKERGEGLFNHYMNLRTLIWPDRYRHKWTDLIYKHILENEVTVLMGCASSQKTSHSCEYALLDYWCFPNNTLVLMSTTSNEKLDLAVFGEIKKLFAAAKALRPWLPGHVLEHRRAITTHDIDEDEIRDIRCGMVGRACYVGGKFVGLGVYSGIKQERVRFLADELQYMAPTFLDCLPNMFSNPDVKVIGSGNPNHDPDSQLGIAAEPLNGWASIGEPTKTTSWDIKFHKGKCLNLVGTDSPNFEVPDGQSAPFPRLIDRAFEHRVIAACGKDSPKYYEQCLGVMKIGMAHSRVITRELCKLHGAHNKAVWDGQDPRVKIYAIDPAYGGGDRCVAGWVEFGKTREGMIAVRVNGPKEIQINLKDPRIPEDQIADAVFKDCQDLNIPAHHVFYDSFGKGTVGFSFARKFGANCPVPINSGERPSKRPVRHDLFIKDTVTGRDRLKRCDEHYSKFITELWFSVRYIIESDQMRELPDEVMLEGCWREYYDVAGGKIEVEPKADMRERTGKSPDLMDWLAIAIEGCRRIGFQIKRLGMEITPEQDDKVLEDRARRHYELVKSKMLVHR